MTTAATDFREYLRGRQPGDWTALWATPQVVVEGHPLDLGGRSYLRMQQPAGTPVPVGLYWNVAGTAVADCEILARITSRSTTRKAVLGLRLGGSAGAVTGYVFGFDSGSGNIFRGWRISGSGTLTSVGGLPYLDIHEAIGATFWVRFRVNGTTIAAKVWQDHDVWPSAAGPEPTSWGFSNTDATHASGRVGLAFDPASDEIVCDYFAFATGGDTAPGPDSLPPTVEILARDHAVKLDGYLEVTGVHRTTLATKTFRYGVLGRPATVATDFPALATVLPTLDDVQIPNLSLTEASFYAKAATHGTVSVTVDNARGSADELLDYVLDGQPMIYRVGRAGELLRTFEPVCSAIVDGEPEIGRERVTLRGKLDGLLSETLRHRLFSGIPTGVLGLTKSSTISVAGGAAFETATRTITLRFRGTPTGAGFSYLCFHYNGSQYGHALVFYDSDNATASLAGRLRAQHSEGGTVRNWSLSSRRYDDGLEHVAVLAIRPNAQGYLMVDGEVIATRNVATNDKAAGGTIYAGWSALGVTVWDVRFYGTFLEPEESRSLTGAILTPDPRCILNWRCDDNSGAVVTDYSDSAKHGALAGTINVDYRWEPTDSGDLALAGQPQPIRCGVTRQLEAVLHDAVRLRVKVHDGDTSTRATGSITVRERGAALTGGGTDYAADAAADIFDLVSGRNQPITVDALASSEQISTLAAADSLLDRNGVPAGGDRSAGFERYGAVMAPGEGGWAWPKPPKLREVLDTLVGGVGGCAAIDRHGRLYPLWLLPDPGGPYAGSFGRPPTCLEFLGGRDSGLYADGFAAEASVNFTIALWFYLQQLGDSPASWDDLGTSPYVGSPLAAYVNTDGESSVTDGWFIGFSADRLFFHIAGITPATHYLPAGYVKPNRWYYAAFVRDDANDLVQVHIAEKGATELTTVVSASTTGTYSFTLDTRSLVLAGGHGRGLACAIAHYQFFSSALAAASLEPQLTDESEVYGAAQQVHFPLNEGEGDEVACRLNVGGSGNRRVRGRLFGCRWVPKLAADTSRRAAPVLSSLRYLRPAEVAHVLYAKNFRPLTGGEVLDSVAQAARPGLMTPGRIIPWYNNTRTLYRTARTITTDREPSAFVSAAGRADDLPGRQPQHFAYPGGRFFESPLSNDRDASRLAQLLGRRFAVGRCIARLSGLEREALAIVPGDSVFVADDRFIPSGAGTRVVSIGSFSGVKLTGATLDLWK